jgi:hypothetical protein
MGQYLRCEVGCQGQVSLDDPLLPGHGAGGVDGPGSIMAMAYGDRCAGVRWLAVSLATGISHLKCRDLTNDQQEWRDIHTYIYNMYVYIYT